MSLYDNVAFVPDPLQRALLNQLEYPNPPAGYAVVLVNVGESEPVALHIDLYTGVETTAKFQLGEVVVSNATVFGQFISVPETVLTTAANTKPKPRTLVEHIMANTYIMDLIKTDGKIIQAIKETRAMYAGTGLKEAKDAVDEVRRRLDSAKYGSSITTP